MSGQDLKTLRSDLDDVHARLRVVEYSQTGGAADDERFRIMADSAPVLLWIAGPDGLCTFFNQPWLIFTGRPLEDELGSGWAAGIHPEDFHAAMSGYLDAFVEHRPFRLEYRLRRADGEYRWLLDTGVPRYLADGTFAGYIGSCIDVADRRRAEETLRSSESRLRGILDAAADGIVTFDERGKIESVNPAAERMFGYEANELVGCPASTIVPELGRSPKRAAVTAGGVRVSHETVGRHRTGALIPVEIALSVTQDPRIMIAVVRDVTERRDVDRRILEAAEALKVRLGQDLHDGVGQLITGIALMAQGLAEDLPPSLRPRGARLLDLLTEAIGQVRNLAKGLAPFPFAVDTLEEGLREVAERSAATLGIQCRTAGIAIDTSPAVRLQLCMIAVEAISNAVRHGGAKHVELMTMSDGGRHVLSIEDDGIGFRSDPSAPATGMGLVNMRYRARMIGGLLDVESRSPRGAAVRCAWWGEEDVGR